MPGTPMADPGGLERFDWSRLNHLQVGRYAEYFVKMEFTLFGFEVYTSEVDDRGIDFVVRRAPEQLYEIQVKSVRGYSYIFIPKAHCSITPHRLIATVVFHGGKPPALHLIPMTAWKMPDALLVSRDYQGKKSNPEWDINISAKNQPLLDRFTFERVVCSL